MFGTWKRAALLCSALAVMLLAGGPLQAKGGEQDDDDGPDVIVEKDRGLVKVTHLYRAKKGPPTGGGTTDPGYKLAPWKWTGPLDFFVYTKNLSLSVNNLDGDATFTSVSKGFAVWNGAAANAPVSIPNQDKTSTPPTMEELNTVNQIMWAPLSPKYRSTIAYTVTWYDPNIWLDSTTHPAIEFDMVFNTKFAWSTTGEGSRMDVQNITAHESGHAYGLDHSTLAPDLTMYPTAPYGETQKRDLAGGDITGITVRYQ